MLAKIDHYINKKTEEWGIDDSPVIQLNKLKTILETKNKTVICNEMEYGVYGNKEPIYGGHRGTQYTLDEKVFLKEFEECMENWWVPTIDGYLVDIWLIK